MSSNRADGNGLYPAHVRELQERTARALRECALEGVVLHSGTQIGYHADDQHAPFHSTPHFAHWLPLAGPGHLLLIRPDEKPLLIRLALEDYWYEPLPLDQPFWADAFEIRNAGKADQVWKELPSGTFAFVGDCPELAAEKAGIPAERCNPTELLAHLDWGRSLKTEYEVDCISEANRAGAAAHQAARREFEAGGSELEGHMAYLKAVGSTEAELPYPTIVALNEKGAILHYEGKRTAREGKVLLIDCGARHRGYASDITRTWTRGDCPVAFSRMVEAMETLQQDLCDAVRPGLPYPDLHHQAHVGVGELLREFGILKVGGEEAVAKGLTRPFFPHGLGHFLGIQVHDVSGHQARPGGGQNDPPPLHPYLRTTRTIDAGQVFTIEPGIYFIDMLLRPHRDGEHQALFGWDTIDELSPCGGIRIEDNLLVTETGHRNLTREYLP